MMKFWNWKNDESAEGARTLELYGVIAEESWWGDEITPQMFCDELDGGDGPVTVVINSPGGDCIAASQIYTMLVNYAGKVNVLVDGIAASAASVIAMAGDTVTMAPTAMMMIHDPMTMAFGSTSDMEQAIDVLNEVKESIVNAYELKTHLSRAKISHLMSDETWMNARKAIELGFADAMLRKPDEDDASQDAYTFRSRPMALAVAQAIAHDTKATAPVVVDEQADETETIDAASLYARLDSIKARFA